MSNHVNGDRQKGCPPKVGNPRMFPALYVAGICEQVGGGSFWGEEINDFKVR